MGCFSGAAWKYGFILGCGDQFIRVCRNVVLPHGVRGQGVLEARGFVTFWAAILSVPALHVSAIYIDVSHKLQVCHERTGHSFVSLSMAWIHALI